MPKKNPKTLDLVVTQPFMWDGEVQPINKPLNGVPFKEAVSLMHRGRAVVQGSLEDNAADDDTGGGEKPLSKMNREELNAEAAALGLEGAEALDSKKDVIALIEGAQ